MSLSLQQFLDRNDLTVASFAKVAEVDKATLYKIVRGERGCGPETADKIERATGGAVTPNDLTKTRLAWIRANPRDPQKKSEEASAA